MEAGIMIPEYWICNHCGQDVKSGIFNLVDHQQICPANEIVKVNDSISLTFGNPLSFTPKNTTTKTDKDGE